VKPFDNFAKKFLAKQSVKIVTVWERLPEFYGFCGARPVEFRFANPYGDSTGRAYNASKLSNQRTGGFETASNYCGRSFKSSGTSHRIRPCRKRGEV